MTVREIMELTGARRGTIEQFRVELQNYGLIKNNQSLDKRAVDVFARTVKKRQTLDSTLNEMFRREILREYSEEVSLPFHWTTFSELTHLKYLINTDKLKVHNIDKNNLSDDFQTVFRVIIPNFVQLAKTEKVYGRSSASDGNPDLCFKCVAKDYIYYIVGKLNRITNEDDIHVFYNDDYSFNIHRCKHVGGGSSKRGIYRELLRLCNEKVKEQNEKKEKVDEEG